MKKSHREKEKEDESEKVFRHIVKAQENEVVRMDIMA